MAEWLWRLVQVGCQPDGISKSSFEGVGSNPTYRKFFAPFFR
jgi:hypothetical protein